MRTGGEEEEKAMSNGKTPELLLRQLFDPETSTYTYLLADPSSREAVLIDPVREQLPRDLKLIDELGLVLKYALDTHVHADHVTALGELRVASGARTGMSHLAGADCADLQLKEGDRLHFGRFKLQVLETRGHTDSCLSYYGDGRVYTGDALLIRGCGRTDFQSGNAADLYDSVTSKLFTLPDAVKVYPAHDYRGQTVSTIGEEKRFNPRLTLSREAFVAFMQELKLPHPKKMMEAVPANRHCGNR